MEIRNKYGQVIMSHLMWDCPSELFLETCEMCGAKMDVLQLEVFSIKGHNRMICDDCVKEYVMK